MERQLSIIIPCLNERDFIAETLRQMIAICSESLDQFEIIVIDDHSTDGSPEIVKNICSDYPMLRLIERPTQAGLGAAIRDGFGSATLAKVTLFPGDNAYDVVQMGNFFSSVNDADIVIGVRMNQWQGRRKRRAIVSRVYNWMLNTLFFLKISDYHGPIIFPRDQICALNLQTYNTTSGVEILIKLLRKGASYTERQAFLNKKRSNDQSNIFKFKTVREVSRTLFRIMRNQR